jgi:hypothetical protein
MVDSTRVLLVTQRPSDFTEMGRVAQCLGRRNYAVFFLHHLVSGLPADGRDPVVERMQQMRDQGDVTGYFVLDECPRAVPATAPVRPVDPPPGRREVLRKWVRTRFGHWPSARPVGRLLIRLEAVAWRLLHAARQVKGLPRLILRHALSERQSAKLRQWSEQARLARRMCALYAQRYKYYHQLLKDQEIDLLILPEDVVGMVSPLLIKVGRRLGIPSLILPYTMANQQEAVRSLCRQELFQRNWGLNSLASLLFPRWRMRDGGVDLVRLPAAHIIAHEFLRVTPPDPWMMNSGFADAIGVENESMWDYYVAAGIPPEQLHLIGALHDDTLYSHMRNKQEKLALLRQELGLSGEKPLLLIGGWPDQLSVCPGECEFSSSEAAVDFMAQCLRPMCQFYDIVVRPHPNYLQLGDYFAQHGIYHSHTDTAALVAVCDLYVAFGSATIRWAIACGVPTINYDLFQYDYDDYKQVAGVQHVRSKEQFQQAIAALRPDSPAYAQAKARMNDDSRRWGMLDGQSGNRIELAVRLLMEGRHNRLRGWHVGRRGATLTAAAPAVSAES